MTSTALDKTTIGFGLSAAVMSILNALLVIFKELTPPFKAGMASAMGHHWTTHGVMVIVLFILLGFVFSGMAKPESWNADRLGKTILWSVIVGGGALAAFYLLH
ncbi:MAG TPA: hypothetical protein VMB77_03080 [Syntrophales bacterium]|nr:hypothetical protein [Syntrophales bacterium]